MHHLAPSPSSATLAMDQLIKWAVPDFDSKTPFDRYNMWCIPAPLPFILLQIHLLLRYNPKATWLFRASLAPLVTLLVLRFSFAHYYTATGDAQIDGRGQHMNFAFGCGAACMIVWTWGWGLTIHRPKLKLQHDSNNGAANKPNNDAIDQMAHRMPVFFPGTRIPLELDLLLNLRGVGWEHGLPRGAPALPVPKVTSRQRTKWFIQTLPPCILYYLIFDFVFQLVQDKRVNVHAGTARGGSIWHCNQGVFGATGPYLVCIVYATAFICPLYICHTLLAALAIGAFNDMPHRWEPRPMEYPWFSTSVHDFWSHRWHQYLRISFMTLGFWPVRAVVEPLAGKRIATYAAVLGAFIASGLIHDVGRAALAPTPGWAITNVSLFFAVQPVAIFGEQLWQRCTGFKVRGALGWLWAVSWLILTSPLLFDIAPLLDLQPLQLLNQGGLLGAKNMTLTLTRRPVTALLDWIERTSTSHAM